ncbi:hypothetical protein V6N13_104340 [Hibiscus sabdariffa]|uniref:Uncharacterized protein n=2 Tax=Hibiscus sabdariffa TaxID=183260 RepID=A0ABR1ZR18_9ROSI
MAFENSNLSSTPVVAQSGRPPDLATAMPAINGSMVSTPVMITQAGLLDDNMDTDAEITVRTDLKVSPRPSFRDMVAGRSLVAIFRAVTGGSRFNVLNVEDGDNHQSQVSVPLRETNIEPRPTVTHSKDPGLVTSSSNFVQQHRNVAVVQKQLDKPALEVSNSMERDASVSIVAEDTVVSVPSSLKPDKHKVVRVIEEAQPRVLKDQNGHQSYGPIRSAAAKGVRCSSVAVKNLPRKEGRVKKNTEFDGERTVVVDWALSLSRSLSTEGELVSKSTEVPAEKSVETSNGGVQWIENSTFEGGSRPPQ